MMREAMERWYMKPTAITLVAAMALGGCARRSGMPACTVEVALRSGNEVEVHIEGDAQRRPGVIERVDYGDGTSEERTGHGTFPPHTYREAGRYAIAGSVRYPSGKYLVSQSCVGANVEIPRE